MHNENTQHPTPNTQLLNLGCGQRFHNEWINVDFHATGKGVIAYNLNKGIPFNNETFDVVYHSHIIEHFAKEDAPKFLAECYRVLKSNGIIRVAFPDLEQIVLHYIRLLTLLKNGNSQYEADYDWIMLELYDQTVRNISGGDMLKYFICDSIPNEEFVLERCGIEVKNLIMYGKSLFSNPKSVNEIGKSSFIQLLKRMKKSVNIKRRIKEGLFGKKHSLEEKIGKFRLGGEIHQWMYDSYSLGRLLKNAGFKKICVRDAYSSYLENWSKYNLDTEPDGSIYKPDSSYIEGIK